MSPMLPVFFSAPHRVMFFGGGVQLLLLSLWWAAELGLRLTGTPLFAYAVPLGWLHGLALAYGVFPFFIFGFGMTAMPRWQGVAAIGAEAYRRVFLLMFGGWLLADLGLFVRPLAPLGLTLALAGLAGGAWLLLKVAREPRAERAQLLTAVGGMWVGVAGGLCGVAVAWGAPVGWLRVSLALGIWGFLSLVFTAVAHRMIPFFSSAVLPRYEVHRPAWTLPLLGVAFFGHAALSLAGAAAWLWLADLPGAVAAVHLSRAWGLRRSFDVRLLAMLHVGFAWLPVALALSALQSLLLLAGVGLGGLAPLHALTAGFFGTLVLGMVSRVTLGHSGRDLAADPVSWTALWALQAVVLLRLAAEFATGSLALLFAWLAACGWLAVFGAWLARYAPYYWRPRADGRPG